MVSIIAAMAEGNRAIGLRGELPWRLPADLAHFRRLTMGHAVILGRRTWEPIARRGLPGRQVIVLTRGPAGRIPSLAAPAAERGEAGRAKAAPRSKTAAKQPESKGEVRLARSLEEALQLAQPDPEIFIAGGASVYQQALEADLVDRMYLTLVQVEIEADTFFPHFDHQQWSLILSRRRPADAQNPYAMEFQTFRRVRDS